VISLPAARSPPGKGKYKAGIPRRSRDAGGWVTNAVVEHRKGAPEEWKSGSRLSFYVRIRKNNVFFGIFTASRNYPEATAFGESKFSRAAAGH